MRVALLIVAMLASTISANLLLKSGVVAAGPGGIFLRLVQPRIVAGLAAFGGGALIYLKLLQYLPLNIAQSLLALQFVGVILAAHFVLHEPLPPLRLFGVGLIVLGVVVVGQSMS